MISSKFEAFIVHLLTSLKTDITHFCDLETIDGHALVANDGSLASIVQFHGTKSVLGADQFERMIALLDRTLTVYFKTRGHQIQVVFRKDLDASATLNANAQQQQMSADRLQLDVGDLINENVEAYMNRVYDEECYLVFWSRPCLLDPTESDISYEEMVEFRKKFNYPPTKDAQNLLRPNRFMAERHQSFVSKVCEDFASADFGCSVEILDVNAMLRVTRKTLFPDYTPPNWQASVPGTSIPMRWKTNDRDDGDMSEFMYPSLPKQIMVASAEIGGRSSTQVADPTCVKVGNRIYAPMLVEIPPDDPQYFNALFNALNRAEISDNGKKRSLPFSISFMIESDGMSVVRFKTLFSSVLGFSSETNRNINLAVRALGERKRDGACIAKLRIGVMTWVDAGRSDSNKELALRKSLLWNRVEAWGNCRIIERTGNPMLSLQSNVPGLTFKHVANPAPAPLADALSMLPFTRPASPFQAGSIIYRSLDGKILRYQRFSSEQSTWITLISGKPGSGKSVLLNSNNLESCLLPGLSRLPYICVIDVGVSSSGFIDLVRDNLPNNLKHLAVYKRLQNNEDFCINAMDTPLGKREPLPKDRSFLVNFICSLATSPERQGRAFDGMSGFVGRIIDAAYKFKSDKVEKAHPETYRRGYDSALDKAVSYLDMEIRPATTYWELVDALFKAGFIYEAEVAQRYAVPTLSNLIEAAASPDIAHEYGDARVENGMSIHEAFRLGVREAIADFKIFNGHTRFDIGSARIMSLDLQDVAIQGGDAAHKQTTLMYMIARQAFMRKVAFSREDLPYFDPMYRKYYENLINDITEDYKVLCMDEFHKTGGHPLLRQQLFTDARESRKWNMELVLASQLMEDFQDLTKIATSFFILDSGNEETRRWLRTNLGLNDTEEAALVGFAKGAGAAGSTFLARFVTKSATYSQLFTLTAGPMRLWALSTTSEDRKLRTLLYNAMPGAEARALLASKFPSGSCKKYVDRLKTEMFLGNFVDEDMEKSVIERLARELLEEHRRQAIMA